VSVLQVTQRSCLLYNVAFIPHSAGQHIHSRFKVSRGSSWIRIQFPEAFSDTKLGVHTHTHTHTHNSKGEWETFWEEKKHRQNRRSWRKAPSLSRSSGAEAEATGESSYHSSVAASWGSSLASKGLGRAACVSSLVPPGGTMGWAVVVVVACPSVGRDECRGRFDRARLFTHARAHTRTHARSRTPGRQMAMYT
jgi:hypothetical protein